MVATTEYVATKSRLFGLKWIHMVRYELIFSQDGAIWLRIIFGPLLTPKMVIRIQKIPERCEGYAKRGG